MALEAFQIQRIGAALLAGGAILGGALLGMFWWIPEMSYSLHPLQIEDVKGEPIDFSLGENRKMPIFPLPHIKEELAFSFPQPRPNGTTKNSPLLVQLKGSSFTKRVSLPARVDLQYDEQGFCQFAEGASPFWLELSSKGKEIEGKVFVRLPEEEAIQAQKFTVFPEETPLQVAGEFPEGSPFRVLGEARWWGCDLFREKYIGGSLFQRLELGSISNLQDISEGDWLIWKEGKWEKVPDLPQETKGPVARIERMQGKQLIFEGWEGESHVRISLMPIQNPPFKAHGEELFSSVRIRSDKQISCMLEKQCLVLRVGDWVFKAEGHWKVLRKNEEKEAFKKGQLVGELFVLDRIEMKQGQKTVHGSLFNSSRSHMISIELPGFSGRKQQIKRENR